MEQDVAFHLEEVATKLKSTNRKASSSQQWQLINRILAYAASAEQHIAEQQVRIRELEELSTTDELTGLHNRRGLQDFMGRLLSMIGRYREQGVLAYLDLDNFKEINDRFGHNDGDQFLKKFAEKLTSGLRGSDFIARIGGDEFVCVLVRTSVENGIARTRALQEEIGKTSITFRDETFHFKASMGVVPLSSDSSFNQLLRSADMAMYEDKNRRKRLESE
jgi:diguanylate cyclase (GGDEF)-like protein